MYAKLFRETALWSGLLVLAGALAGSVAFAGARTAVTSNQPQQSNPGSIDLNNIVAPAPTPCTDGDVLTYGGGCVAIPPADPALTDAILVQLAIPRHPPFDVFVTRKTYDGNLGGISGAHAKCQSEADAPGSIVHKGIYYAWLSDANFSPATDFSPNERSLESFVYQLPNGVEISRGWPKGALLHAIDLDAAGHNYSPGTGFAFTGTTNDGRPYADGPNGMCEGWRTNKSPREAMAGEIIWDERWSEGTVLSCSYEFHLYCFEQQSEE